MPQSFSSSLFDDGLVQMARLNGRHTRELLAVNEKTANLLSRR